MQIHSTLYQKVSNKISLEDIKISLHLMGHTDFNPLPKMNKQPLPIYIKKKKRWGKHLKDSAMVGTYKTRHSHQFCYAHSYNAS